MAAPISVVDAGLPVRAFFTTRVGGVSVPPYDSLNLARGGDDDPCALATNRGRVEDLAGCAVAYMAQVHGARTAHVTTPDEAPEADAMVTGSPGLALGVLVADCVPLLLLDSQTGAVGAVHAGRRGVAGGVVMRAVEALIGLGPGRGRDAGHVMASVGPAICGGCYEVPSAMRDEVAAAEPAARAETTWGTPSLDLRAAVRAQLEKAGVRSIVTVGACTREDPTLFSHRRDGLTGRFAGVIRCEGVSLPDSGKPAAYGDVTGVKSETNRGRP